MDDTSTASNFKQEDVHQVQQIFEQYSNINGLLAPHCTKDAEDNTIESFDYCLTEEELEQLMSSPDLEFPCVASGHDAFTSLTQLLV